MFGRLAEVVLRHRGATLAILVLWLALAAFGVTRLRVDFSSRSFYGDDASAVAALARFHAEHGADDDLLSILVEVDEGESVVAAERLHAIERLASAVEKTPGVESVDRQGVAAWS